MLREGVAETLTRVLKGKAVVSIRFIHEGEIRFDFEDGSQLRINSKSGPLETSYDGPGVRAPGS